MKRLAALFVISAAALLLILGGCAPTQSEAPTEFDFNFAKDTEGWTGGFADLPANSEQQYELEFKWAPVPSYLGNGHALLISGFNMSDDLFMFVKRRLTGLKPNTTYRLQFRVTFASDAASGCMGIGGSPGESVYVKVGASTVEPVAVDENGFLQMNIDKGQQATGGKNAPIIGNVGNGSTDCNNHTFRLKTLEEPSDAQVVLVADSEGSGWVFVGTDSGFEGKTTLYYTEIRISLQQGGATP